MQLAGKGQTIKRASNRQLDGGSILHMEIHTHSPRCSHHPYTESQSGDPPVLSCRPRTTLPWVPMRRPTSSLGIWNFTRAAASPCRSRNCSSQAAGLSGSVLGRSQQQSVGQPSAPAAASQAG